MEETETTVHRVEMIGNEYEVMKTQLRHIRAQRNTYVQRLREAEAKEYRAIQMLKTMESRRKGTL